MLGIFGKGLDIRKIDRMESSTEKLESYMQYAKKYNCWHDLAEDMQTLYTILKKQGKMSTNDWNNMMNRVI